MAMFTIGESSVLSGQPLNAYKLHIISGDEPPSSCKPLHDFTKSCENLYNFHAYNDAYIQLYSDAFNDIIPYRTSMS
jgi:hypothetical protein